MPTDHSKRPRGIGSPEQPGRDPGVSAPPSPSHGFAAGPSLSPRRGDFRAATKTPLLGEREGPGAKRWEGEGDISPPTETSGILTGCAR